MIVFTRDLARRFRAVARKCVVGRPRGPAPPVICRAAGGVLTLTAHFDGVVLSVTAQASPKATETLVVPMDVLSAVGGGGADPVELKPTSVTTVEAVWTDRGVSRSMSFDLVQSNLLYNTIAEPKEWEEFPHRFLTVLHECGRTTARDPTRFALHRVQVRGKAGQVVGTDGGVALIADGFTFPFADDLLIPALPVFGIRELVHEAKVRVGLVAGHMVVAAGPWTIGLAVDPNGRFPDVAGVVPTATGSTTVTIDDQDAADLLAALPGRPGTGDRDNHITLDLGRSAIVRARDVDNATDIRLARSAVTGLPARVAVDLAVVRRALNFGLTTVRLVGGGKPVVFLGDGMTLIAVPLDPSCEVGPNTTESHHTAGPPVKPAIQHERRSPMRPQTKNGHPGVGRPEPPADAPDLLAEAEAVRAALTEAAARAARLVAALKHRRKEQKALTQVWSSLRSLNLGP